MNDARLWIVLVAAVSFLAGTAAGRLWTTQAAASEPSPWTDYGDRLADAFDLDSERRRHLTTILDDYAAQADLTRTRLEERIQTELEPELATLAEQYEGIIRDKVLPPGAREQYDRTTAPQLLVAPRARTSEDS